VATAPATTSRRIFENSSASDVPLETMLSSGSACSVRWLPPRKYATTRAYCAAATPAAHAARRGDPVKGRAARTTK
jgi:hypothetical protein